jgi:hypothetical protein
MRKAAQRRMGYNQRKEVSALLEEKPEDLSAPQRKLQCWCGRKMILVESFPDDGTFRYACPLFLAGDTNHDQLLSEEEFVIEPDEKP